MTNDTNITGPGISTDTGPSSTPKKPAHLWVKGVSGNPRGRPKKFDTKKFKAQEVLNEIFEQADGDAVAFQKLILKNGKALNLDLQTAMRLAKELSVYQTPKKASIETKSDTAHTYVLSYNIPPEEPKVIESSDEKKD